MKEPDSQPTVSVVMNTLNEAARIPLSLASVRPWADEIVVVDMHSDDDTAEVARGFGARVFQHERMDFADPARAWAVSQSTGEWVLILDADELVPAPLARRLLQIARSDEADVAEVARADYLLGRRLEHSGWGRGQDFQTRFFKRGDVTLSGRIHAFTHVRPGVRTIRLPSSPGMEIVHFNYTTVADFLTRLNRYTSIEAVQRIGDGGRSSPLRGLLDAAHEFAWRYVRRDGFRDGWRGFYLSAFMAFYRLAVSAKVVESLRGSGPGAVERRYRAVAEQVLGTYEGWPQSELSRRDETDPE